MEAPFLDPRDFAPGELLRAASEAEIGERAARRWLGAVMGRSECNRKSWLDAGIFPKRTGEIIADLPRLTLSRSVSSTIDRFQKLLFHTSDGLGIETVLIPLHKAEKVTVCLSSQVGCVMGCSFCATARMPVRRNLKTWEIVDQFLQARTLVRESGREVSGVVFMGMGEPFLNYDRVLAAAELFSYPVLNAINAKAITISTVGLVQEIRRFTDEKRPFRLSISLGAATDEKRAQLVPVAAKTPVKEVIAAARRHAAARGTRVMLSYVCISGVNVSVDDARALGQLIGDTPVRLDLIDVTDSTGRYSPPSPEELAIFRDALTQYVSQPVARRYSGGKDIQAACGTLSA